ncbi:MAG: L-seryl-tRNA(Sec) selenium transferase [Polyangiaceae bacterium]|nr:L-seryl-tRNA(Sec) selenium transferase [Polyangiaceae bacterium]
MTLERGRLPKVDRVALAPELDEARATLGRRVVVALARDAIAAARHATADGHPPATLDEIVADVSARARARGRARVVPALNATGVVLHTNLGRAPLPAPALARIAACAAGYASLEMDLPTGARVRRGASAEARLAALVGAREALVVNNNAAGVLLALSGIAAGREVVVSRGELVEIGGGFRIPEVLARSGCRLVEVGTTNKTRVEDFERALGERTACLLRVHPSNFRIEGYAERPALGALARLAHAHGIPIVKDLGGGRLGHVESPSLREEPTVEACLAAGADLVCFSLDKLFGGPQGGAVVGDAARVRALRDDPLARALRLDKLRLAALEAVLDAHERSATEELPALAMLLAPAEALLARVEAWRQRLGPSDERLRVIETTAAVGGGSLAELPLPSAALAIAGDDAEALARALRCGEPPVVPRIERDRVLLDARTISPTDDERFVRAVAAALGVTLAPAAATAPADRPA